MPITVSQRSVLPTQSSPVYENPSAPVEAFGGGQGRGLIKIGDSIQQATDDVSSALMAIQIEDDKREFKQLDAQLANTYLQLQYGDGTADNPGYLSMNGENAIGGYQPTYETAQAQIEALASQASNPRVANMFKDAATERLLSLNSKLLGHLSTERDTAFVNASKAQVETAVNEAAADPGNADTFEHSLGVLSAEINEQAAYMGWDEDTKQAAMSEQYDILVSATVTSAMRNDPDLAFNLFEQNADLMGGVARADLAAKLEDVTLVHRSQQAADYIESLGLGSHLADIAYAEDHYSGKLRDEVLGLLDRDFSRKRTVLGAAREDIRWKDYISDRDRPQEIQDTADMLAGRSEEEIQEAVSTLPAELRVGVLDELDDRNTRKEKIEAAEYQDIQDEVSLFINQGGRLDDWMQQNPDEAETLQRNTNVMQWLEAREDAIRSTDLGFYGMVMTEMTPEEILAEDEELYAQADAVLPPQEAAEVKQYIRELRISGGVRGVNRELQNYHLNTRIADLQLGTAHKGRLQSAFLTEMATIRAEKGREPTEQEVIGVLDNLTSVIIEGTFRDTRAFQYDPEEHRLSSIDVPDEDKAIIRAILEENGVTPTSSEIARMYLRKLGLVE